MLVDLDDVKQLSKIDQSNMMAAVDRFPDIFLGPRNEPQVPLKEVRSSFKTVVLMGMGGSASAADVVLVWLRAKLPFPAFVHRKPGFPSFFNSLPLFIALS